MKHFKFAALGIYTVFILLVLLLSSCKINTSQQTLKSTTGNDGLTLQFSKNSPPDKVLEGNKIYPAVDVWNKGSYALDWAAIYLDTDTKAIRLTQKRKEVPLLYGKNIYNPEGDSAMVLFDEYAPVSVPFGTSYSPILSANLCYQYKTIANPTVCILPNPEEIYKPRPVCRPDAQSFPNGQGAPVALAKLETEPMQGFVTFIATLENLGNGMVVFKDNLYEKCPYKLSLNDVDYVYVDMKIKGLQEPDCYPTNKIVHLVDGRGIINCKFLVRQTEAYMTPLQMEFDYGYLVSIKKQIKIFSTEQDFEDAFEEFPDSTKTPALRVTGSTSCQCATTTEQCLCVRISGFNSDQNIRCESGVTIQAEEGINTLYVFPSDASITTCNINSKSGPCNEARKIELHSAGGRGAILNIEGLDYNGRTGPKASCSVNLQSSSTN